MIVSSRFLESWAVVSLMPPSLERARTTSVCSRFCDMLSKRHRMKGPTVSPETWERLENEWKPGGCVVSVHDSAQADSWLDAHYDSIGVKRIRSRGYGGPLASRLSLQTQALTVFGEVSLELIRLAKHLAKFSGFSIIIRPRMDDPVIRFRETQRTLDKFNISQNTVQSRTESTSYTVDTSVFVGRHGPGSDGVSILNEP